MAQSSRYPILLALLVLLVEQSRAAPTLVEPEREPEPRAARLLDRFNHRYPDGSYEFRFELDDGTARYERGYFALINEVKSLMVVGYYSYRMPDGRYITVFYNADQFGYRQNQSITPEIYPNLPRSIEVPAAELRQQQSSSSSPTTSRSTTSRSTTSHSHSSSSSSSSYVSSTPRATALPTRRGRF